MGIHPSIFHLNTDSVKTACKNINLDIVIPYQQHYDNRDLRWALASFRKYLKGIGNVFIIGDDPGIDGLIHMPFKDGPNIKGKELNIYNKIVAACEDIRVSDNFLFANDDHFILDDYNIEEFPAYYSLTWPSEGQYGQTTVVNTLDFFSAMGITNASKYYDVHCPIIYNKKRFLKTFNGLQWPNYGFCIKTVYAYLSGFSGVVSIQTRDYKIREWIEDPAEIKLLLTGARWFSTNDKVYTPALIEFMRTRYED